MKNQNSLLAASVLTLLPTLFACSSVPNKNAAPAKATAVSAPTAPAPTTTVSVMHTPDLKAGGYQLPAFEERTLPNGLRILFIPDDKLPYISFSMLVHSGSAHDPDGQEGLSAFVAELLDKGTVRRSATQVAQELGDMGAEFEASSSYDYSLMSASGLSVQGGALLKNFAEIILQPAFSDGEIERMRKQFLAGIERRVDSAEAFSDLAFSSFLYGAHPYGRPATGTAESVKNLRKKQIIRAYLANYRPNNSILSVVGQYTPEFKAQVEHVFTAWERHDVPPMKFSPPPKINGLEVRLVEKADLTQTQIRLGQVGINRKDPDFLSLRVANTILGGAFASRLNSRIRKDLGLTYNISSFFDAREDAGPFEVETFTKNATTGQTVTEALKVIKAFHDQGVTGDEVDRAKGYLKGIFPTAIETPEKLAINLMLLRVYGVPDSYLTNYLRDIERLSATDINRAITNHIDPSHVKIVVYSSGQTLDQLKTIPGIVQPVDVKPAQEIK